MLHFQASHFNIPVENPLFLLCYPVPCIILASDTYFCRQKKHTDDLFLLSEVHKSYFFLKLKAFPYTVIYFRGFITLQRV